MRGALGLSSLVPVGLVGGEVAIEAWSNGETEGQITKLKLVKREMYGRAKVDLLEARLTGAT